MRKKYYIAPKINIIVIDRLISMAMISVGEDKPPPGPWGVSSGGNNTQSTDFPFPAKNENNPMPASNTFQESPFK
jgi:hypothetical protein